MVEEYTAYNLAVDSDEERRLEKAERAADRKAAKQRKKRSAESVSARPRGGQT